jgi:hypothetical protein
VRIITLLEQVPGQPPFHPEQLLSAPLDAEERAYIVQLLTQNQPFEPDEKNDYAQRMRDFMISWIQSELQKRTSANLQQQIQEAERLGNIRLRDELVAGLQSVQRKRTDADLSDFL